MLGTTQGQKTKVPKLKNSRMLGNTLVMSKVTHTSHQAVPKNSSSRWMPCTMFPLQDVMLKFSSSRRDALQTCKMPCSSMHGASDLYGLSRGVV